MNLKYFHIHKKSVFICWTNIWGIARPDFKIPENEEHIICLSCKRSRHAIGEFEAKFQFPLRQLLAISRFRTVLLWINIADIVRRNRSILHGRTGQLSHGDQKRLKLLPKNVRYKNYTEWTLKYNLKSDFYLNDQFNFGNVSVLCIAVLEGIFRHCDRKMTIHKINATFKLLQSRNDQRITLKSIMRTQN